MTRLLFKGVRLSLGLIGELLLVSISMVTVSLCPNSESLLAKMSEFFRIRSSISYCDSFGNS